MRSIGLDPAAEVNVGEMVSDTAYYDLLERIAALVEQPTDLPLRAGQAMNCDDYGAFGLAFKTAPNLRGSFARAERYWRLLSSVSEYELRPDGQHARFLLHRAGERRLGLRLSNEATLASVTSMMRQVAPRPFSPLRVMLKHAAPKTTALHEDYFGCPLEFNADADALVVSGEALGDRNRLADEGITRFLLEHLNQELQQLEVEPDFRQQVSNAIIKSLSAGVPRVSVIARRLGMSERTLQRRLREQDLSFQKLVDSARRDLAEGLLVNSDYSLTEIAFLAGFSEQSAFTRAFRRWGHPTPAAFREAGRSQSD